MEYENRRKRNIQERRKKLKIATKKRCKKVHKEKTRCYIIELLKLK